MRKKKIEGKLGKRIFDIFFSFFALIFTLPILVCLYILIRLTSSGPGFYKAQRAGKQGKVIYCLKLRTMKENAKEELSNLLAQDPKLREEWDIFHKLKEDPRLTRLGKVLRKTSLDEFPQFWNVLKGDLSIVGPRPIDISNPETVWEEIHSKYLDKTEKILSVRPGLTSLWQVKGRNCLTFKERAILEEEYIDTQSFFLDLKIICKTMGVLFHPKGAY